MDPKKNMEKLEQQQQMLRPAKLASETEGESDDLEEEEAILIKADESRFRATSCGGAGHGDGTMTVKEISAPYAVPHYPIELEEAKRKEAQQVHLLKDFEERATHMAEDGPPSGKSPLLAFSISYLS